MPRFFIRQEQIDGENINIYGDDAHHISRSLRMAAGESITVCDMQGVEYDCTLEAFLEDRVVAKINSSRASEKEPPCVIRLFQALPKGEKLASLMERYRLI